MALNPIVADCTGTGLTRLYSLPRVFDGTPNDSPDFSGDVTATPTDPPTVETVFAAGLLVAPGGSITVCVGATIQPNTHGSGGAVVATVSDGINVAVLSLAAQGVNLDATVINSVVSLAQIVNVAGGGQLAAAEALGNIGTAVFVIPGTTPHQINDSAPDPLDVTQPWTLRVWVYDPVTNPPSTPSTLGVLTVESITM